MFHQNDQTNINSSVAESYGSTSLIFVIAITYVMYVPTENLLTLITYRPGTSSLDVEVVLQGSRNSWKIGAVGEWQIGDAISLKGESQV